MPRIANKLTAGAVAKLRQSGRYADGAGLSLVVSASGKRSWAYRYQLAGTPREMTLGDGDEVSLAKARELAADARKLLANKIDPLEDRRAQAVPAPETPTFREVAAAYIERHEAGWHNAKHRQQWGNTLAQYAFPVAGDLPVDQVATRHVVNILSPIWATVNETASRLRGRLEVILDFAKAQEWREGENPARWRGHLQLMLPPRAKVRRLEHHAALDWRAMPDFYRGLRARGGMSALALRFAILTAARSGEVRGATWSEIDLATATWTLPPSRMKAGRQHRAPLTGAALDVLRPMAEVCGTEPATLVFPGRDGKSQLSDMSLGAVLKRMNRPDLTCHGFRSTFRDWCAENGKPRELAELSLAHAFGSEVERAYFRSDMIDQRRALMDQWAEFCCSG